jgi:hypothetical protein
VLNLELETMLCVLPLQSLTGSNLASSLRLQLNLCLIVFGLGSFDLLLNGLPVVVMESLDDSRRGA